MSTNPFSFLGIIPGPTSQGDRYIWSVIAKQRTPPATFLLAGQAQSVLAPLITSWAGGYLLSVTRSGSFAKGTTIKGDSDLDLLVSLRSDAPGTMAELYRSLEQFVSTRGYVVRQQNVSIRVASCGLTVDITPARRHPGLGNDHTLYRSRARTWTKTNVYRHIQLIKGCGRIPEIRALKIWRSIHGMDFPSFYLELVVLEALRGHAIGRLEANVLSVLRFLADELEDRRIVDPSNAGNVVSEDLTVAEKQAIANQASRCLNEQSWGQIIW